ELCPMRNRPISLTRLFVKFLLGLSSARPERWPFLYHQTCCLLFLSNDFRGRFSTISPPQPPPRSFQFILWLNRDHFRKGTDGENHAVMLLPFRPGIGALRVRNAVVHLFPDLEG